MEPLACWLKLFWYYCCAQEALLVLADSSLRILIKPWQALALHVQIAKAAAADSPEF